MSEIDVVAVEEHDRPLPPWWVPFVIGVLALAAGVVVLVKPNDSLDTLAVITGIFILIDGIVELAASLSHRTESRGTLAVIGILSVIAGVLLIRHPVVGVTAVALVLAIWMIAIGVVRFVAAMGDPHHRARRTAASSALAIAGVIIVASPHIKYATLALITGLGFIAYGAGMVVIGLAIHAARRAEAPGVPRAA